MMLAFSRTSRAGHLPAGVEFIKDKSGKEQDVIVCFGANLLDQLTKRFEDGDFESLTELVDVSFAQAEEHFKSWVQDPLEQALITDRVKTGFKFLAWDVLGLELQPG